MRRAISLYHKNLSSDTFLALREQLDWISKHANPFRWASACAGTDLVHLVLRDLSFVWKELFDLDIEMHHAWSAEKGEMQQRFIKQHWPPKRLFADCHDLQHEKAHDTITKQKQAVEKVHLIIAGTECDSISGLNINQGALRGCVRTGEDKTGTTLHAMLRYLQAHRPMLAVFENVKGICKKENMEFIRASVAQFGYAMHCEVIKANQHGAVQVRDRAYIIMTYINDRPASGPPVNKGFDKVPARMRSMKIDKFPLSDFLDPSPDDSSRFVEFMDGLAQNATHKPPPKKDKQDAEYLVQHLEAYQQAGLSWPPNLAEMGPELNNNVLHLPVRMQQLVYYFIMDKSYSKEAGEEHFCDINYSMKWYNTTTNELPCIVCSSKIFSWKRKRELWGGELLAVQGIDHSEQRISGGKSEKDFSSKDLTTLAGNAFSAFAVSPALICAIASSNFEDAIWTIPVPTSGDSASEDGGVADSDEAQDALDGQAIFSADEALDGLGADDSECDV